MTDQPPDQGADNVSRPWTGRPLDPKELRRHHHAVRPARRGEEFLRALTRAERHWMTAMVGAIAREHQVDPDDLLQDLQLGLLQNDVIDAGRSEVRSWLRQRARWKAKDLRRKDQLRQRRGDSLDDMPDDPPVRDPFVVADSSVSRSALERLGLNRDEAQVMLLHLWGLDVSLQEFAELVHHSYAKTRQDSSRGMNKIRKLFDLEPDEYTAYVAKRGSLSVTAAAAHLGWSELRTERLARLAEQKVVRILEVLRDPDHQREEADPDAL